MEVDNVQWKATAIVNVHILDNAIRGLFTFHLGKYGTISCLQPSSEHVHYL
jgi:hypothetical protein